MPDATPNLGPQRLPIPTALLCLVAMAALYITSKQFLGLPLMVIALIATYFTNARLPTSPLLAWAVRVVIFFTLLLTANPEKRPDVGSVAFDPSYTNLLGYCMAAELTIRAWVRRRGGPSKGEMVFLSALVFTAATNAGDMRAVTWIRALAPLYLVLLILTLRRFRDRPRAGGLAFGWVAAMLLVVSLGLTWSWAVSAFEGQITRWSMQFLSGKARESNSIGLSRTATLGRSFNPNPSARRVLKLTGFPGEHHLRAATFDQYTGGTWGPPIDQREFAPVTAEQLAPKVAGKQVHVTRYDSAFNLLFLPLETASLHLDAESVEIQQDAGGDVRVTGDQAVDPLTYTFTLPTTRSTPGVLNKPLSDVERKWDLVVPHDIDPAVRLIAERVATGTPVEKLARIQMYLRSTHHYSLDIDPGDGEPISAFLLKKLDGHCEYFAASAVILARCAGIPARYVTGYYAHEPAGDDTTIVRSRDAHAWAECWVDGAGWVTVDATPSGGRPDVLFPETPAWRRHWERVQDFVQSIRAWLGRRTLMEGAIMIAALAAIPVLIRVYKGRSSKQKKLILATLGPPTPELASLVQRFERLLRRRKLTVPPNRTWREHLTTLPGYADFLTQYNALRFGNEGTLQSLSQTLERLERAPTTPSSPSS